jgi:putative tryptophan/tyrosine transport system substrate-binding protein
MDVVPRGLPVSRRAFVQGSLALAGIGLFSGCTVPPWTQRTRALPRVGFLKQPPLLDYMDAFREGMREHGYVEGENFIFDYRYVEQVSQLPDAASELVQLPVDVLVCPNVAAVDAARLVTSTIPIVFVTAANPITMGYAESLSRPGKHLTGPSQLAPGVTGKRLQLLREIDPRIARVGVFLSPENQTSVGQWQDTQEAAEVLGLQLLPLEVRQPVDFESAFGMALSGGADALFLPIAQLLMPQLPLIAQFAAAHRIPAMAFQREFPDAGGLMSYGASIPALYRRAAYYVDKILKGAKPAEIPVEQPTTFAFIINLKTAQALGLTIPPHVLLQATEVLQ